MKVAVAVFLGALAAPPETCGFVFRPAPPRTPSTISDGLSRKKTKSVLVESHRRALVTRQTVSTLWATEQDTATTERLPEPQFITILTEHGQEEMLPTGSTSRFPLWVVDGEDEGGRKRVVSVPGASSDGWVDPVSYNELWVPEDSPAPTMKLCLGMLIKDGVPRYVMPMVDLVVVKAGQSWRNRGLKSVPAPHCWEPVNRAVVGALSLSAYAEEPVEGSNTDSMWGTLAENLAVTEAFTEIIGVLADPPEGLDSGSGFHFIAAEIAGSGPLPVPSCGGRVRVFLDDLPDSVDLLELPGFRGVSGLGFDVVSVVNGGESEFLPEVYRPLFAS